MAIVNGKQVINNMQIETSTGTVYWQEDEPLEPKDGDTWFKVVNGKATNSYNRENGVWVEVAFSSQIIAEELIGKIITGAEINGGVINGTEINGGVMKSGEFLNEWTFRESGVQGRIEGFTSIKDGIISSMNNYIDEPSEIERQKVGVVVQNGAIYSTNTVYDETGKQSSYTGASLEGGALTLSRVDLNATYNGMLDARLLESISQVKTRVVTLPNTSNFRNATITYYRWGQYVTVQFYFELLKDDGWVGLSSIEDGYKPISNAMVGATLMSNSYRSYFCGLYANASGFRLVPSVWSTGVTSATYQGAITYMTNQPWYLA